MWRPTSGKPNRAPAPAIRTSHSSASTKPPAIAGPLTAATSGSGKRASAPNIALARLDQHAPVVLVAAELRHVHARRERAARAGQDDAAELLVGGERGQRAGQLVAQLDRQRVALVGPVERDDGDALGRAMTTIDHAAEPKAMRPRGMNQAGG